MFILHISDILYKIYILLRCRQFILDILHNNKNLPKYEGEGNYDLAVWLPFQWWIRNKLMPVIMRCFVYAGGAI
jgi:hypothetical protein